MNRKRFTEIDIARGIGIILVVLGHSLKQTGVDAKWIRILLYLIYGFHMPLFFVLSGFVAVKILDLKGGRERAAYIRGRAQRLLIPYFTVGIIYIPVKLKLSSYAVKPFTRADIAKMFIGQNPDVSLWFLYVLFVISVICVLLLNRDNFMTFLYGSLALCVASYWVNIESKTGLKTPQYLFFFLLGMWIRMKAEEASEAEGKKPTAPGDVAALIAIILFAVLERVLFRTGINVLKVGTSLTGIYATLWAASKLSRRKNAAGEISQAARILRYLGLMSMDIYILHEPVMTVMKIVLYSRMGMNYVLCTFLIFASALVLPVIASKLIIRKIRPLRLLLLGER